MQTPAGTTYAVIISHPTRTDEILVMRSQSGWTLPQWHTTDRHFWQSTEHITAWVRFIYNMHAVVLRCLALAKDPIHGAQCIYALDLLGANEDAIAALTWMPARTLLTDGGLPSAQRDAVQCWLDEHPATIEPLRPPWTRHGWFAEAQTWIATQPNVTTTDEIVQVRTWERSTVLRVPTVQHDYYFKAVPPFFAHEPRLTQALSEWYPDDFPVVMAVAPERSWLLLRDFGSTLLATSHAAALYAAAVRRLAELQCALADRTADLRALGVPFRSLDALAHAIPALLADTDALRCDGDGLSDDDIARLRAREAEFIQGCADLAKYGIPDTLEHGDFGPTNIAVTPKGFCFFDWSDSSIAHPFFSQWFFPGEIEDLLPDVPDAVAQLRAAYLAPWAARMPDVDLGAAYHLAMMLAPLFHAVRYHRDILPHMAARWQMERMIPAYLRTLC